MILIYCTCDLISNCNNTNIVATYQCLQRKHGLIRPILISFLLEWRRVAGNMAQRSIELDLSSMFFLKKSNTTRCCQRKLLSCLASVFPVMSSPRKTTNEFLSGGEKVGIFQISTLPMWVLELIYKAALRLFSTKIINIYISYKQPVWATQTTAFQKWKHT